MRKKKANNIEHEKVKFAGIAQEFKRKMQGEVELKIRENIEWENLEKTHWDDPNEVMMRVAREVCGAREKHI